MKTIEERAKAYPFDFSSEEAKRYIEIGYIGGATEQDPISRADERKKMIDKVSTIIRNLDLRKCMVGGCVMTDQIAISVRKAMEDSLE